MYDADNILDEYVCSAHTRITKVEQDVDCLWQEVNVTQENVLGFHIPPCGINADGTPYHYRGHIDACIISAATSMDDADVLLDEELCKTRETVSCVDTELKRVEDVLGVAGDCEKIINYPKTEGCLLSSATTFAQADAIMEAEICHLLGVKILGSERPTSTTNVVPDEVNPDAQHVQVDVRLSHGNELAKWQTDDELIIQDYHGDLVDEGDGHEIYEFTDTNVLRIVDLTGELGSRPESKFNGLYLSNIWDCGEYTLNGEGTPYEKYKIDPDKGEYYKNKYRNGVRYING